MVNKFLFALAFGICAVITPLRAQDTSPAPASDSGKVAGRIVAARIRGTVTATDLILGTSREIHDGDQITEHYRVTTTAGASAILVFENGATVDIGSATSMNIDEFRKDPFKEAVKMSELKRERGTSITKLSLIRGELVGKVVHLNVDQGSEFTVDTPVGAAGIRGTTFRIVFEPEGNGKVFFSVTTQDGRVLLTGTTSQVSIPAGKQVSITVNIPTSGQSSSGSSSSSSTPPVDFKTRDTPPSEQAFIQSIAAAIVTADSTVTIESSSSGSSSGGSSSGGSSSSGSSSSGSSSSGGESSGSSSGPPPSPTIVIDTTPGAG